MVGDVPNPAGSVQLAANPTPPMYAAPTAQPNEAPGKVVADEKPAETEVPKLTLEQAEEVLPLLEEVKKVSKPKKKRGEVVLDVEPETVSDSKLDQFVGQKEKIAEAQEQARVKQAAPTQADVAAPTQANPAMPTKEQMDAIKATLNTYTQQLAPSEGMPAMIKMRAFITRLSDGVPPQSLTMPQWEGVLTWFSEYEKTNGIKATLTHINETLGVK